MQHVGIDVHTNSSQPCSVDENRETAESKAMIWAALSTLSGCSSDSTGAQGEAIEDAGPVAEGGPVADSGPTADCTPSD